MVIRQWIWMSQYLTPNVNEAGEVTWTNQDVTVTLTANEPVRSIEDELWMAAELCINKSTRQKRNLSCNGEICRWSGEKK